MLFRSGNAGNTGNTGNGGAITLTAGTTLSNSDLDSYSYSYSHSDSDSGNEGNGGAITLTASNGDIRMGNLRSLSNSSSEEAGRGGDIFVSAIRGDVTGSPVSGGESDVASFASAGTNRTANQGGDVTIKSQNRISDLAITTLSSSSSSGSVELFGSEDLTLDNVSVVTSRQLEIPNPFDEDRPISIDIGGQGQSGQVLVRSLGDLTFTNSLIQSDTNGNEAAGDITMLSPERVTFNNSRIISNTNSTGSAGNITIRTNQLSLNDSELTADTQSGGGGNIRLQDLDLLTMQNSLISTAASEAAGGGNISINTPDTRGGCILGSNNSDIIATAVNGAGGQIDIYPDGIFGFVEQAEPNLAILRANNTNDISASSASGPQGVVNIPTLVNPTQNAIELPTDIVDASSLVAQGCATGNVTTADELSEFVITGRGGLSSNPTDPLSSNATLSNWIGLHQEDRSSDVNASPQVSSPNPPLVEAQGWVIDANGEVILTAQAPTATDRSQATPGRVSPTATAPTCTATNSNT